MSPPAHSASTGPFFLSGTRRRIAALSQTRLYIGNRGVKSGLAVNAAVRRLDGRPCPDRRRASEGFDAVVRTGQPADSRLSARKLGTFETILVASPDYLARRGTPNAPADLRTHICLHYRYPNSGKLETWPLRRTAGEPDLQLPISMICNNIETRMCFALQGRGIACLPDFAIREPLADGRLRRVLPEHAQRRGVLHVLWPASKHPSPKVRALVDFLGARVFPAPESRRRPRSR